MIYVLDVLSKQFIYINPLNVIYASQHNNTAYYDVYLNSDFMIQVHEDQFLKIKKGVNQCLQ